jgi:DNA-binding SARP family transcriptional activator
VYYRVLGPVVVCDDRGEEASLGGAKQRTVLAALLLGRDRLLSDSALSGLLWGNRPPATLNQQIYTYVSRLRGTLGRSADIVRRGVGYQLVLRSGRFDLAEFTSSVALGREALSAGRYAEAAAQLAAALDRWRGPALQNTCEHLLAVEGPRLDELRMSALESRIEADLALGGHAAVLPELIGLVQEHPLRERFRALLMTGFYGADRQADALALYDEGRRVLADELGVDPGLLLRGVHQAILRSAPGSHVLRLAQVGTC